MNSVLKDGRLSLCIFTLSYKQYLDPTMAEDRQLSQQKFKITYKNSQLVSKA